MAQPHSQFVDACQNGDEYAVSLHLECGVSVNSTSSGGNTVLWLAAAGGHQGVARQLLRHSSGDRAAKLDPNHPPESPPLVRAVELMTNSERDSEVLCRIFRTLYAVQDSSPPNSFGVSIAAMLAARGQSTLLKEYPILLKDPSSLSPLSAAVIAGELDVVEKLLDLSVDPDEVDPTTNTTPLMLAAVDNAVDIVRVLLCHGADATLVNINGANALDLAKELGHTEMAKVLQVEGKISPAKGIQNSSRTLGVEDLIDAVKKCDLKTVHDILLRDRQLVNKGSGIEGATPLMYAAMMGHKDIVVALIEHGADLDAQDNRSGWTPLMQSLFYGHWDVAKALITAGCNVRLRTLNGCTATDLVSLLHSSGVGDGASEKKVIRMIYERAFPTMGANDVADVWGVLNAPFQKGPAGATVTSSPPSASSCKSSSRGLKKLFYKMTSKFSSLSKLNTSSKAKGDGNTRFTFLPPDREGFDQIQPPLVPSPAFHRHSATTTGGPGEIGLGSMLTASGSYHSSMNSMSSDHAMALPGSPVPLYAPQLDPLFITPSPFKAKLAGPDIRIWRNVKNSSGSRPRSGSCPSVEIVDQNQKKVTSENEGSHVMRIEVHPPSGDGKKRNGEGKDNAEPSGESLSKSTPNLSKIGLEGKKKLHEHLRGFGLEKHHKILEKEEVDFYAFCELTEEDIRSLGIQNKTQIKQFTKAIQAAKKIRGL